MRLFAHITENDCKLFFCHKSRTQNLNSRKNRPLPLCNLPMCSSPTHALCAIIKIITTLKIKKSNENLWSLSSSIKQCPVPPNHINWGMMKYLISKPKINIRNWPFWNVASADMTYSLLRFSKSCNKNAFHNEKK